MIGKRARSGYGQKPLGARKRARTGPPTARAVANAIVANSKGLVRVGGNYGRYGVNAVQQGMKPELKFFDTALAFAFDRTAEVPATGQLTLIPQGDTESTRDGRLAMIKSVQIKGVMSFDPAAAATASAACALYLVLDTQANGAAAAVTDVFTSNAIESQLINLNNSGRFRILKRWIWTYAPSAGVGGALNSVEKTVDFYKKCNVKVDWSSTTGAITEIRSNNLFLIAGSAGNASDDTVTFAGVCRLRFVG